MQKKRKIFTIFDEISSNFVDGIREGLTNLSNIVSNVVEFMELAGSSDMLAKDLQKIEIDDVESEQEEEILK
ncbi:MAG: hypothetical protein ACTSRG_09480 [Candidatus Helarchaeota archaeon]